MNRRFDLQEAESGGLQPASVFVRAENTCSATIEAYAEDNNDVDFYLVGYWSDAPGDFEAAPRIVEEILAAVPVPVF